MIKLILLTVSYKGAKRSRQHPIVISYSATLRHQAELKNTFNGMAHRGFLNIFCIFHLTFLLAEEREREMVMQTAQ